MLTEMRSDVSVVAYPSIIEAQLTDIVHSTYGFEKSLDMSMDAGQEHAIYIQAFDQ